MRQGVLPPFVRATEWIAGHWFDGILAPTEQIVRRFPPRKTHLIRNFPILSELIPPAQRDYADRPKQFAYVGGLTENRNIDGMMDGVAKLEDPDARLRLAGTFFPPSLEERILSKPEWERVIWDGWVSRQEVASLLGDARAGLVLLRPIEHEMLTLPIKMFEYMAAGLPVISSDFPLWRDIIEKAECGLLVDPMDVSAIAGAMQWILDHPDEAERMGQRGRAAIEEHYSWEAESRTLLSMTRTLLGEPGDGAHPKTPDAPESLVETP
ncbi:MAG: glycosyltransferase family 4 protein [Pseudomonadota bacterium]